MTDNEEIVVTSAATIIAVVAARRLQRRRQRSCWVWSWMLRRLQLGTHTALLTDRQTKGWTDGFTVARTALCTVSPVNFWKLLTACSNLLSS